MRQARCIGTPRRQRAHPRISTAQCRGLEKDPARTADELRARAAGITCVGDISRRNVAWQALKRVPIRKVCFVELLSIADHAPRDLAELRDAVQSVEEDELLTVADPVLQLVPDDRRPTLIATPIAAATYRLDIVLQGENETVFFEFV